MASQPRELVAETVRERAMNGEIPRLGTYSYRRNGPRGQAIQIPKIVDQNVAAEPDEDEVEMYADLANDLLIIDFSQDEEDDA
jgi:hypothetical protein